MAYLSVPGNIFVVFLFVGRIPPTLSTALICYLMESAGTSVDGGIIQFVRIPKFGIS